MSRWHSSMWYVFVMTPPSLWQPKHVVCVCDDYPQPMTTQTCGMCLWWLPPAYDNPNTSHIQWKQSHWFAVHCNEMSCSTNDEFGHLSLSSSLSVQTFFAKRLLKILEGMRTCIKILVTNNLCTLNSILFQKIFCCNSKQINLTAFVIISPVSHSVIAQWNSGWNLSTITIIGINCFLLSL